MGKLLLIGPQLAGKTTFLNSARNIRTPDDNDPTGDDSDTFWLGVKIGRIIDTAGNLTQVLNNRDKLSRLFEESDAVAFMFNGKEFLSEISNPQQAGVISSIIKNLLLPVWKDRRNKDLKLFFVANYNNDAHGGKYTIADSNPKELILKKIKEANENYFNKAHRLRYPFVEYFATNRFYCIDARNFWEVQRIGKMMLK